jgi:hypothetical protein
MGSAISNTVNLRVNEMVKTITEYIVNTNTMPKFRGIGLNSFMLWGPPGVGKSASLATIMSNVEQSTGKKVVITDVRLLLFNPVDLRGIPVPNAEKTLAKWLKPEMFQMDSSEKVINILMLDEISAAAPSVQAAAYQITLDRKVGEHKLPDNCYVICAGNRMQDKSVAYKMPKALANRLTHFDIGCELEDWKVWAMKNQIDSKIIGYLNFKPTALYSFDPSSDDNAFPTPRTWEMTDNYLQIYGSLDSAFNCIAGCLGLGTAGEFKRYCSVFLNLPRVEDIFDGKKVDMPTKSDVMFALSAAISGRILNADTKQIKNAVNFIFNMPSEFSVLTMKDILLIPKMKEKLIMVPEWLKWATANKMLII